MDKLDFNKPKHVHTSLDGETFVNGLELRGSQLGTPKAYLYITRTNPMGVRDSVVVTPSQANELSILLSRFARQQKQDLGKHSIDQLSIEPERCSRGFTRELTRVTSHDDTISIVQTDHGRPCSNITVTKAQAKALRAHLDLLLEAEQLRFYLPDLFDVEK